MNAILRHGLPLLLCIVLWEVLVRLLKVPAYILPPPSQIMLRMQESAGLLLTHSAYSSMSIAIGFISAVASGFFLAIAIAYYSWVDKVAHPFIVISQVIPKVALAPLFLIWFGHGLTPKIIIVATIAFFPVLANTIVGLKSVEREVVELMQSVSASKAQTFWKIRVPTALPYVFPAIKVAALLSVVGAMVAEFVGTDRGLGYVMILGNTNLETDLLFAAILAVTIIGLVLYGIVDFLERLVLTRFGDGASSQLVPL